MRAAFYTNEQLVKAVRQLEKDWKRLYPDGNTGNPLYEWELENYKIKSSENTIYVKLKNKKEVVLMY